MRTLRRFNAFTFLVAFILVSGCASTHATKTAPTTGEQIAADSAAHASSGEFIGPDEDVKPAGHARKTWMDYMEMAFLPVTFTSGLLLWYSDLPGVK